MHDMFVRQLFRQFAVPFADGPQDLPVLADGPSRPLLGRDGSQPGHFHIIMEICQHTGKDPASGSLIERRVEPAVERCDLVRIAAVLSIDLKFRKDDDLLQFSQLFLRDILRRPVGAQAFQKGADQVDIPDVLMGDPVTNAPRFGIIVTSPSSSSWRSASRTGVRLTPSSLPMVFSRSSSFSLYFVNDVRTDLLEYFSSQ